MIIDGRAYWVMSLAEFAERVCVPIAKQRNLVLVPPGAVGAEAMDAEPAPVEIIQGTIYVCCMSRGCAGKELLWLEEPLLWCGSCGNAELGGRWRPVLMPTPAFLTAVDKILALRPLHQRTWLRNETLHQLVAQSKAHRDRVPDDLGDLATNDDPYSVWLLKTGDAGPGTGAAGAVSAPPVPAAEPEA